jgi:hypothetical protein
MEDGHIFACEHRTAVLLCAVLYFVTADTVAANRTTILSNANQSCLDEDSSDLKRNCPVRTFVMNLFTDSNYTYRTEHKQ